MSSVSAVCVDLPPPEKKQKTEFNYESDDEEDCREIMDSYYDSVMKSGGFDVIFLPPVDEFGIIQPVYRDGIHLAGNEYLQRSIQEAIKAYNNWIKDPKAHLEFVKLIMAMREAAAGVRYYITFDAKVVGTDNGNIINTYQAVVVSGLKGIDVESFRLKPQDEDQGSSNGWCWEGHIYKDSD